MGNLGWRDDIFVLNSNKNVGKRQHESAYVKNERT